MTVANLIKYSLNSTASETGGKEINVARYAPALERGPADHKLDFFTIVEHEIEHALGFYPGLKRYDDLSAGNKLKIPTTISGAPSDFDLPIITNVGHINDEAEHRLFAQTVESNRAVDLGSRRFISDIDKLAI